MNKLSYEEVIKIFDGANFPFISVSKNGVFISSEGLDEKAPEYAIIREMAYNHPNKDTTKPLFTFPCTINELRDFLHDNDESCQLSGVIYIDKGKKYTASEVIDLMVEATVLETSLLPDDEKMGVFSQQYKKQFLDDHQLLKNDYQESMTQYLKRYSITVLGDETEQKLKDISLENIMDDVINWLQGERFAVFFNSQSEYQNFNIKKYENLITTTLVQNGYELMALPVGNGKKSGAKAFVWEQIGNQFEDRDSFDYYWKKLKRGRVIVDAK